MRMRLVVFLISASAASLAAAVHHLPARSTLEMPRGLRQAGGLQASLFRLKPEATRSPAAARGPAAAGGPAATGGLLAHPRTASAEQAHAPVAGTLGPGARVWLHAHNCYPDKGRWEDRIVRALAVRAPFIAIEQDIAWRVDAKTGRGESVVSHDAKFTGSEPSLERHFFERVRPLIEAALAEGRRETWPVMVLHLDFKTNEPAHHQAIWDLLGRHLSWLTTAERAGDDALVTPFAPGPLLVLTEAGEGQAGTFHARVPAGERLRIFGTVPPAAFPDAKTSEERAAAAFAATPERLIATGATNYRRWTNFAWNVVERGGQKEAGAWTRRDAARLRAIVTRAHQLGLWVRFYTLNGHVPGTQPGWTESYNFGSLQAAQERWRAAIAGGVEFIASDQYEELGRLLLAK